MHDARSWRESGLAQRFAGRLHADSGPGAFADSGYTGTALLVPQRRTGPDLLGVHARKFNKLIVSQRACVERCIAYLKSWRLLATGYRGPLDRFDVFLDAITKLKIYRTSTYVSLMTH